MFIGLVSHSWPFTMRGSLALIMNSRTMPTYHLNCAKICTQICFFYVDIERPSMMWFKIQRKDYNFNIHTYIFLSLSKHAIGVCMCALMMYVHYSRNIHSLKIIYSRNYVHIKTRAIPLKVIVSHIIMWHWLTKMFEGFMCPYLSMHILFHQADFS